MCSAMKIINILISCFLYITSTFVFVLFGLPLVILSFISKKILFKYIPFFCRILLFSMGVRLKSIGHFPKNKNYVIMCNHTSFIDVFTFPCYINGYFTAISAKKNFKIPIFGTMLRAIKAIPIDRKNRQNAIRSIQNAEHFMKKSKYSVVILPEGTRTLDGKLKKFKKGGFHMALNAQLNILPMVSVGSFQYKPKNRFTLQPTIVTINIGDSIKTENHDIESLMKVTYNEMSRLIEESN